MTDSFSYGLTSDAQADLSEISRFTLDQWGQAQALKYLSEMRQTMRLLSRAPAIGTRRPEVGPGIFSFPHGSHVIYYTSGERQLMVFAVLHKSMVPMDHLDDREVT